MVNWFDNFFDTDLMPHARITAPAVNVKESPKAYTMQFAAPGLKKEFCRVNLDENDNLEVNMESKLEHKDEDKQEHYLRREFTYSNFEQKYALPDDVDKENISATVNDGVLEIILPKLTKTEIKNKGRMINVG